MKIDPEMVGGTILSIIIFIVFIFFGKYISNDAYAATQLTVKCTYDDLYVNTDHVNSQGFNIRSSDSRAHCVAEEK